MKKKLIAGIFGAALIISGASYAAASTSTAVEAKLAVPKVEINGVAVTSDANHFQRGKIYVDVQAYTDLIHKSYTYNKRNLSVTVDGKRIPVKLRNGKVTAPVDELAKATGSEEITYDNPQSVYVLDLPTGAKKYHPVIPGMGQHWIVASDEDIANGTIDFHKTAIYGSHNGKLTFIEQMIDQAYFVNPQAHGLSLQFAGMEGLPAPAIQHTDMDYQPVGHAGFEVPHFDIHHYYVSHDEHMAITGAEEGHH